MGLPLKYHWALIGVEPMTPTLKVAQSDSQWFVIETGWLVICSRVQGSFVWPGSVPVKNPPARV